MSESELRGWNEYGFTVQSPVVRWLPVISGIGGAVFIAWLLCPAPRKTLLTAREALAVALFYVVVTTAVALGSMIFCARSISPEKSADFREIYVRFAGVAAWFAPVMAYYARNSSWVVITGVIFGAFATRLFFTWQQVTTDAPPDPASPTRRRPFMLVAAACLELAVVAAMAGSARPAAALLVASIGLIIWFREVEETSGHHPAGLRRQATGAVAKAAMAFVLTAGALTPYLARPMSHYRGLAASSSDMFDSTREWIQLLFGRAGGTGDRVGTSLSPAAYAMLESVFGDEDAPSRPVSVDPSRPMSMTVISGSSFPGVILRPPVDQDVKIVSPARRDFSRMSTRQPFVDHEDIPFYGAYWYFRRLDIRLPSGAIERRGDPVMEMPFRSNDVSPMVMEAVQNLGREIDMHCCRAIEVTIRNADFAPKTVRLELTLMDTLGHGHAWLGQQPVESIGSPTMPARETITFPIPAESALGSFDQLAIRFQLRYPRGGRSARISIDHFRLVRR